MTTPRRLLVRCLFEASGHRTAEELAAEIQARAPDISISTVYRNLEELERLGVVVHSHLGHGPATYHLATAAHGHLVCRKCEIQLEIAEGFFADLRRRDMNLLPPGTNLLTDPLTAHERGRPNPTGLSGENGYHTTGSTLARGRLSSGPLREWIQLYDTHSHRIDPWGWTPAFVRR